MYIRIILTNQAVKQTQLAVAQYEIFMWSREMKMALEHNVHGPRKGGILPEPNDVNNWKEKNALKDRFTGHTISMGDDYNAVEDMEKSLS